MLYGSYKFSRRSPNQGIFTMEISIFRVSTSTKLLDILVCLLVEQLENLKIGKMVIILWNDI